MSTYMSTQSAEKLLQDMMRQYCGIPSVYPDMKKLREVLTQLSDQQKLHILQQEYSGLYTPLHYAAWRDDTEIISTLLTSLQSSADRLKVLMSSKYTPLHTAARCGHTQSVRMILDCLTADQQIQIMSVQHWLGLTAIQYAQIEGRADLVRVLAEYQHRADNLMREEYNCYEKKFGIILYNPSGREGAVEEAHNLQSGLQAVGCQVIRAEWTTKRELSSLIDEGVNIVAGCSLLVVCIMSHGGAGTLRCEEGETREIVINDVIQKLRGKLPELTPLVILIQACQQSEEIPPLNSDDDMAMGCSPEDKTHVVLNRPHTALLMATMRDGFAKRGAYTEAIAEQLHQADGKSNLEDMHTRAVLQIVKKYGDKQTPEYRSTLKKRLVLRK